MLDTPAAGLWEWVDNNKWGYMPPSGQLEDSVYFCRSSRIGLLTDRWGSIVILLLSIDVLTNEVWITWNESFIVLAINGNTVWLCLVKSVSFISLGGWSIVVMWWQTFTVSRQFPRHCAERRWWSLTSSILVSLWRWSILDILCESVMILGASFCACCILFMLVSLAFVLETGATLFAIDLPYILYVNRSISFCCPQLVPSNAFKTLFLYLLCWPLVCS